MSEHTPDSEHTLHSEPKPTNGLYMKLAPYVFSSMALISAAVVQAGDLDNNGKKAYAGEVLNMDAHKNITIDEEVSQSDGLKLIISSPTPLTQKDIQFYLQGEYTRVLSINESKNEIKANVLDKDSNLLFFRYTKG